jgi:hypothetical protein
MAGLDDFLAASEPATAPEPAPAAPSSADDFLAMSEPVETGGGPAQAASPPSGMVRVMSPDGKPGYAPEENVRELVRDHGYKTLDQAQAEQLQAQYGTGGQQALAGAEGFGRGVSFGLTDLAQQVGAGIGSALGAPDIPRAAGPGIDAPVDPNAGPGLYDQQAAQEQRAHIEGRKAAHPITAGVTEVAGMVLPALATGGAGAAGRAVAMTPAARAAALGARVQQSLAGKWAAKGALGRIGALGAAGAVEGGLQQAAQTVVDDLKTGDWELSAERMVDGAKDLAAHVGLGAALGGLGGGVAGAAVEGVGALAKKIGGVPKISDLAGESAYKAFVGRTNQNAIKLANRHGGASEVGKTLLKHDATRAALTGDAEAMAAAADQTAESVGAELGAKVREADALGGGAGIGPKRSSVWSAIDENVLAPLRKNEFAQDILANVEAKLEPFKAAMTRSERPVVVRSGDGARALDRDAISFEELNAMRKKLDETLRYESGGPPTPVVQVMREVRRTIEGSWMDAAEKAGEAGGKPEFAATIRGLKRDYAHLALARDEAQAAAVTQLANRSTSLTDTLVGAATGAGAGDPLTGFVASQAHKYVRERGRGYVALGLDAISKLAHGAASGEKALTAASDVAAKAGARAKVISQFVPMPAASMAKLIAQSHALLDENSPDRMRLHERLATVAIHAPELADALAQKELAKAQFIAQAAGPATNPSDPWGKQPYRMEPTAKRKTERAITAVHEPQSTIERIAHGTATQIELDAMRAVYPRLYQRFVDQTMQRLNTLKDTPPLEERLRLSRMLGQPLDRSQQPQYLAFLQSIAQGPDTKANAEAAVDAKNQGQADSMRPAVSPGNARFNFDRKDQVSSDSILNRGL